MDSLNKGVDIMFRQNLLRRKLFASPLSVRKSTKHSVRLTLEALEDRAVPAAVSMYWDPTNGANASQTQNWDTGSLGSGMHPTAAPGQTAGETDNIYFDGSTAGGNKSCTWDYTPANALGSVEFQNGWTQTVTFLDKQGFSVSSNSFVIGSRTAPTLTPNGASGANAVAAITLTNGAYFADGAFTTLYLTGYSTGNAKFFAGDGKAGEYFEDDGTVTYNGSGVQGNIDYLNVPVFNQTGIFNVKGGNTSGGSGSTLQVSGTDTKTNNVSFYQTGSTTATYISEGATLWCVNNYTMTAGALAPRDTVLKYTETLMVGTGGSSPVDGTVTVTGGTVYASPSKPAYETLKIVGTTSGNNPILNVGTATLSFNVNMTAGSTQSSQLIVGNGSTGGKINFGYLGGTTTVVINNIGTVTPNHQWQIIFFNTETGNVTLSPATGYTPKWNAHSLEIDN